MEKLNLDKKGKKMIYEFCKSGEFEESIKAEFNRLNNEREQKRNSLREKHNVFNGGASKLEFKKSAFDSLNGEIIFKEFWKVLNKKSDLPSNQRIIVYEIGIRIINKK